MARFIENDPAVAEKVVELSGGQWNRQARSSQLDRWRQTCRPKRRNPKPQPTHWARLTYDTNLSAYRVELSDEELRNAPSSGAGEEFDWGDRSRELEIHN